MEGKQHGDVVSAIKAGGDETKLLVVDKETDEFFKKCKVVPSQEHLNGEPRGVAGGPLVGDIGQGSRPASLLRGGLLPASTTPPFRTGPGGGLAESGASVGRSSRARQSVPEDGAWQWRAGMRDAEMGPSCWLRAEAAAPEGGPRSVPSPRRHVLGAVLV